MKLEPLWGEWRRRFATARVAQCRALGRDGAMVLDDNARSSQADSGGGDVKVERRGDPSLVGEGQPAVEAERGGARWAVRCTASGASSAVPVLKVSAVVVDGEGVCTDVGGGG